MESQKAIVTQAAQKYGVDPRLLWGLYGTETSFGKNVSTSSAGAVGPFQFEPATARGMGVNPLDFKSAAYGAARYLSQYKNRGVAGMLSAYNAGPAGRVQQGYVDTTLKNAQTYGSAPNLPVAEAKAPGITAIPGAPKAETPALPTFDKAGFEKAQKAAVVGKLLASEGGAKENPLLLTGVATAQAPVKSEYESESPTGTVIAEHKGSPIVKVTEGPNAGKAVYPQRHPGRQGRSRLHRRTGHGLQLRQDPRKWAGSFQRAGQSARSQAHRHLWLPHTTALSSCRRLRRRPTHQGPRLRHRRHAEHPQGGPEQVRPGTPVPLAPKRPITSNFYTASTRTEGIDGRERQEGRRYQTGGHGADLRRPNHLPRRQRGNELHAGERLRSLSRQDGRVSQGYDDAHVALLEPYLKRREQLAPRFVEAKLAEDLLQEAGSATEAIAFAVEQTYERLAKGEIADPARAARDLSQIETQAVDKRLALQGRPTQISEHRSPDEIVRALEGMGVVKKVDAEGTAIEETADAGR